MQHAKINEKSENKNEKSAQHFEIIKTFPTFVPVFSTSPDGGIGRRAGLKHQWIHFHAGSTPALGTKKA